MIPVLAPKINRSDFTSLFNVNKNIDKIFNKKLKESFNFKYSQTFSSGRAALFNILKGNGIKNKLIIVSSYTCCVVTEAIVQSNNKPFFIDTEKYSFNAKITEEIIKININDIGAILITNLFGFSDFSNLSYLKKMNKKFLVIVDDSMSPGHAMKSNSNLIDYIFISSNVRKPYTCLGGGLAFTNSKMMYNNLFEYVVSKRKNLGFVKILKKFIFCLICMISFYPIVYRVLRILTKRTNLLNIFYNERNNNIYSYVNEYYNDMCSFQKSVGLNQLTKLNYLLENRKIIGNNYYRIFTPIFSELKNYWKINTQYSHLPFLHPNRNKLQKYLYRNGIDTELYFDYIIPELKQYISNNDYPNSKHVSENIINLPLNYNLKVNDIKKILKTIKNFNMIKKFNI